MGPDQLFQIASLIAFAGWLPLAFAPLRRRAAVLAARMVGALLAGGYTAMLLAGLVVGPGMPPGGGFDSLAGVAVLFSRPEGVLLGWVHFLAFDLWAGAWEAEDAPAARVPHALLLPCLALTFLAGPFGLLFYLLAKAARRGAARSPATAISGARG